ncbi:hypothetical protein JCM3766R1_000107 [Sporobolomyces carnicolor]
MPPKLTQPLRPVARYRKGQAPAGVVDSDSDSDQDEQQQEQQLEDGSDQDEGVEEFTSVRKPAEVSGQQKKMGVKLGNVQVDQRGTVKLPGQADESSEYETDTDDEDTKPAMPKPTFNKPGPSSAAPATGAEEESSEYETDSEEEEEPLKPIYKPVFVSKRNRDTIAEREKELDPEVVEAKRAAEIEKQKEQSKNLVADSIVRELAQKETEAVQPDVDDTDGLDPEAEFEEWKLRELTRLKRDKEARYALEKIKEEVEARRSMPEALRLKEDTERAEKSRKEKKKGSQVFLQKYHHKGAFHQDQEILKKHDYTAPTISTVDVSSLPAVLQKRNFGKMSQSKYTHLADQDTSRKDGGFGGGSSRGGAGTSNGNGCFNCGGPHLKRDCPQLNDPAKAGPSGSNSSALPSTSRDGGWGSRPPRSDRDDDRRGGGGQSDSRDRPPPSSSDRFAPSGGGRRGGIGYDRRDRRDGGEPRRRSRSRSRSPPRHSSRRRYDDEDDRRDCRDRDRDRNRDDRRDPRDYDRRERRRSTSRERDDREKRRRVD